jgi:hypothetical protein
MAACISRRNQVEIPSNLRARRVPRNRRASGAIHPRIVRSLTQEIENGVVADRWRRTPVRLRNSERYRKQQARILHRSKESGRQTLETLSENCIARELHPSRIHIRDLQTSLLRQATET